MTAWLHGQGYRVNRKRVTRLMRQMGIEAIYAKPKLSQPIAVTACNRNGSGLHSAHFWARIICLYPSPQDHISCH